MALAQLGNTRLWPFSLRSIGRQLRDAPSDWRRSSFAFPDWRLPGWIHFREGSTPLAVGATRPQPNRSMLPWNTCGHTQGLVRKLVQPSNIECNFMSRLTMSMSGRSQPPATPELPLT